MEKTRIAVSGINGFVGHHLARELAENGIEVIGIGHDTELSASLDGIVTEYHSADLIEKWPAVENIQGVVHLAGLAAVGPSFDDPQRYITGNSSMITNMCEYFVKDSEKPRIVIVSSGAIYSPDQPMPINEEGEIGYTSPYAVSKVLVENQAKYYRRRGIECVVARPFNHIGPDQNKGFILPDFYERLSTLPAGESTIKVGNIETRRDYTDVRDIVRAYARLVLAKTLQFDTYNVCSGQSLSGADVFNELTRAMGIDNVNYTIDQALVRPTDIMEITGDSSRIQNELDWSPQYSITESIADFVRSQNK